MKKAKIEIITPAQAEMILNYNQGNRPIRDTKVELLSRANSEGRWKLTNDAIAMTGDSFASPGRVLNGQHRLFACVESGKPIEVLVLYGADEDAYAVMDTGSPRKAKDLLPGPNQSVKTAMTNIVFNYHRNELYTRSQGMVCNDEALIAYEAHPSIAETCERYLVKTKSIMRAVSGVLAGFALIRESDEAAADDFIQRVLSGVGLAPESPELTLRNRLIMEQTRSGALPVTIYAAMVIKTWNAYVSGSSISKLQFRDSESFPRITSARPSAKHRRAS